ncbi:uncharacterized protein LOC119599150 [Penaeus monodon]|uniref:uncharacterized protein LOC119599150 n=1 Tax=Penaeus monodon TaxID=6687 RepID=UPI0018A7D786|nr:uncharacterized protein LOC119599150 [Penaeus monodon]
MRHQIRIPIMMQAMAIVSALHIISEGVFPAAEGTGEPYGINRKVVEGAARAGASVGNPAPSPRQLDGVPVPALNQVVAGDPPGGEVADVFEAPGEGNGTARALGPGSAEGPPGDPAGAHLRGTGVEGSASIPECNKGQGQLRFEKITGTALARSPLDKDVIRDTKIPAAVAAVCAARCLKEKTAQQQLSNVCTAFDFIPGISIDYYNSKNITFQESKCFLTRQADPNVQPRYEDRRGTSHFREVCYSASTVRSECPTRMYVMERVRNHHFVPDNTGRDFKFHTSEECQNSCLNQYADENQASTFVCRSATYDKTTGDCFHSQYTRRTHTEKFLPNTNFDYYENTCLSADRRCPKNKLTFMMEKNKELRGAHITEVHFGVSEQECKEKCLDSVYIFCRRLEYTEESKKCVIIDEDSVSQDYALTDTNSNATYYELFCIDGAKVKGDYLFDSKEDVTEQLNERRYTEVRTAFQLYRNRRLQLKPGFRGTRTREVNRVTLAECLDECLEERSFTCRSVSYSDRYQSCELSEYDKLSGNLEYDNDFHYFENLMENLVLNQDTAGSDDTPVSVVGSRTGVGGEEQPGRQGAGDLPDQGPGGAGQSGPLRPGSAGRFSGDEATRVTGSSTSFSGSSFGGTGGRVGGNGFESSEGRVISATNGFGGVGSRVGSSASGDADGDRFRPRPGLFRPINTDFRDRNTAFNFGGAVGSGSSSSFGGRPSSSTNSGSSAFGGRPSSSSGSGSSSAFGGSSSSSAFSGSSSSSAFGGSSSSSAFGGGRPSASAGSGSSSAFGSSGSSSAFGGSSSSSAFGSRPSSTSGSESSSAFGGRPFGSGTSSSFSGSGATSAFGGRPSTGFDNGRQTATGAAGGSVDGLAVAAALGPNADGSNLGGPSSSGGGHYGGGYSGSGSSRCFEVIGTRQRLRRTYIRDYLTVSSVDECKRRCEQTHSYYCKSFNFRYATSWDNCELSDEDTIGYLSLNNPSHFESDSTSDYYERTSNCGSDYGKTPDGLDVQQVCSPDGMEFTLRTEEPFRGRIYTYGYYDRCFARGSGSSITVLKISGPRGFPDCGTTRFGETTTNIVVVQFSDNVQTSLDKRYNLTCTVVGPSESVVTSGYIGAGSGAPTPIEYLPAENQLQSRVKLQILYGGRPTTTIAVGDPLTFRLESQRGFNLVSDIFATNVVAKDPYSGRTVNLIDSRGCPVDNYVFPSLGKARDGDGLEARFNAFKIPESNFLIFEATVKNCRGGCVPARCTYGNGREETESYGRRRRDAGDDPTALALTDGVEDEDEEDPDEEEQVHGIYEVYLSRDEIDDSPCLRQCVCVVRPKMNRREALIFTKRFCQPCIVPSCPCRKHRQLDSKNAAADAGNPYHSQPQQKSKFSFPGSHARTLTQPARQVYFPASEATASAPQGEDGAATSSRYPDPSEPIYTDPSLFERSRSLRSIALSEMPTRRRHADGEE